MSISAPTLITLGCLFLLGVVADFVGRRTPLPRVAVLLLFGISIGPIGFDLLPGSTSNWMPVLSDIALTVIGFLLGNSLNIKGLRKSGKSVLSISLMVAFSSVLIVSGFLWAFGVALPMALLLGGIAPATDPAATVDVIHESKSSGHFSDTLLRITAIDDAWGLILFSLALASAEMLMVGNGGHVVIAGATEVVVSIFIGIAVGIPMSFLTGRIQPGEPTLIEALGMVFICSGISLSLDASYLLSSMSMGAVVANLAKHHDRPFHAIEGVEWPVVVLFFIFAGMSIRLESLAANYGLILVYLAARIVSRFAGAVLGARLGKEDSRFGGWMGMALMPQAGVALGMALTVAHRFEGFEMIVSVIAATTVFFEIIGPVCTRFALRKMGNIKDGGSRSMGRGC